MDDKGKSKLATILIGTILLFLTILSIVVMILQAKREHSFAIICLGSYGGVDVSNLNAFLISTFNVQKGQREYLSLDAGSSLNGIIDSFFVTCFLILFLVFSETERKKERCFPRLFKS